jgi:lipoprotein-releasing system permease protein
MSRLPFEFFLALRYLRPKRTFVSAITLISVLGVMLGVGVLIIVIGVMTGFDRDLRDKFFGFHAHLKVTQLGGLMEDYHSVLEKVSRNPNVKGAAPFVMGQILVKTQPEYGNPQIAAQWMRGIDVNLEKSVSQLPFSVVAGDLDLSGSGILIGTNFAQDMGLRVSDRLAVYSNRHLEEFEKQRDRKEEVAILPEDYTIKGIFDLGYYEFNSSFVITSLANAQDLYNLGDKVHGLMVMVRNPFQVETVKRELLHTLGPGFGVTTWLENSTFLDAVVVEKNVMFIVLFFITIVAAFGIMNSLITFVVNKTREIGMLKALGASNRQVLCLFLSQSLIVGVSGILAGLIFGIVALHYRNEFLHFMRDVTHLELFPASIYGFSELPALVVPSDLILICGTALLACLLAAALPVRIAVKLKPVEALRHE